MSLYRWSLLQLCGLTDVLFGDCIDIGQEDFKPAIVTCFIKNRRIDEKDGSDLSDIERIITDK